MTTSQFRAILMLVLQVPPTSIIHKCKQKTPAGQTLYITLSLHIYGGGKLYFDKDMQNPGIFDHFPEETGWKSEFFRMSASNKLSVAFNNRALTSKKN